MSEKKKKVNGVGIKWKREMEEGRRSKTHREVAQVCT